nr:tolloid-like protein 1 isoform X2 [Crassostrea virginica]
MTIVVSNLEVDCGDGGVAFYDGESTNAFKIARVTCRDHCQSFGTVNHLFVAIYTDVSFQMTILIGKDESRCSTSGFVKHVNLTNDVTLTSPYFPYLYPVHFECNYAYAHSSGRIKVTFLYLDLEHGFDYVEISDGISTLRVNDTTIVQKPFLSEGPKITLKFYSDSSIRKHGFKALISPVCFPKMCESTTSTTPHSLTTSVLHSTDNIITELTTSQILTTLLLQSTDKSITDDFSSISSPAIIVLAIATGVFCFGFFIAIFAILKQKRHSSENRYVPNVCYEGPSSATKPDDYEIPVSRHKVSSVYDELPPDDIGASSRSYTDFM